MNQSLNENLLVLIPKIKNPVCLSNFRPISLCNVIYKIITKLFANRLKPMLNLLVSETQSSFVTGRNIYDNILIVQEVIHSMKRKTGKIGWMAIKIDLEKAYDRVKWDFVEDTLLQAGFSTTYTDRIMCCVRSSAMKVLWNGNVTESFYPTRGIRQGDPMSPYLFVFCMERLGHLIQDKLQNRSWRPISLSKDGPPLSHLFFADDLFIFEEASREQAHLIQDVLQDFCTSSG